MVNISTDRDSLFSQQGRELLEKYYSNGKTPQHALAQTAETFSYGDNELSQFIYDACSQQHFFYSSPILSNAPIGSWDPQVDYKSADFWKPENTELRKKAWLGEPPKAMPIACFLSFIPDTIQGQQEVMNEIALLSVMGGGTSAHSSIRAISDKAPGPIPYFKVVDGVMGYYRQGKTRRGSCAIYMNVDHPDIIEFVKIRTASGGDPARKITNRSSVHNGVNLTQTFCDAVENDTTYDVVCPHTKIIKAKLRAREVWEVILETRELTGEPYIIFLDVARESMPHCQKQLGLDLNGSNLCLTGDTIIEICYNRNGPNQENMSTSKYELKDFCVAFNTGLMRRPVYVKSYNNNTLFNTVVWSEVTAAVFSGVTKELIEIISPIGNTIRCTHQHKIYTHNRGYVEAQDLLPNDTLCENVTTETNLLTINRISTNKTCVYDITVPETECFFANNILVHNCTEIFLPTNKDRTAVCCLSSVNIAKYDEWKNTGLIGKLVRFLDNVLQWFIDWAPDSLSRATYSAAKERAIGIGYMGWHTYLQSKMIPFEGGGFGSAVQHNHIIFSKCYEEGIAASKELAIERGVPDDLEPLITLETDEGQIELKGNTFVSINRNNQIMNIRAFQLLEDDYILEISH